MSAVETQQKLWTKDFIFIALAKFLSTGTVMVYSVTLASYSLATFDATTGEAGVAVGIFIIAALIARTLTGRYVDIIGRKKTVIIGGVAFFVVALMYFLPVGFMGFLVVRFVHGLTFGVVSNTMNVVATGFVPVSRLSEGLGYFSLATTLAQAVGPVFGVIALKAASFNGMFLLCVVLGFVSVLLTVFLSANELSLSEEQRNELLSGFRLRDFLEPTAVPLSLLAAGMTLAFGAVISFVSDYAAGRGLEGAVVWYFAVYALALCLTRGVCGKLQDRKNENVIAYPTLACMAVGYVVLGLADNAVLLFLSAALLGVGYGNAFSTLQAATVKAVEPYRVGLATATYYVFADFGTGIGPMVVGLLIPLLGYSGSYTTLAFYSVVLIAAYFFIHGRTLAKKTPTQEVGANT